VQDVAPDAAGSAVTIVRSADTITAAFRAAAFGALAAITVILFVVLRRLADVLLVLAPLLMSALLTVAVAVLLPLPLNFANVIALPLLLGVGVSFNIYFVMNWRAGQTRPLASAVAKAVVFSALTTATAFGSLSLSHHPGTASMGDLLLLSLACTVVTTLGFLPALLAVVPRRR
jgi:predicted RND superfamily exporter protein